MTEPDNSILCTCGRPWHAVIPPPPCPIHDVPIAVDTGYFSTWEMPPPTTTSTTPVFTEEMIRRAMGQEPCDVSDVPFCGWGDLIPELPTFLGSVSSDTPLDFDGVDDRLTTMQQITPSFSAVIIGKVSDESQEHLRAFAAAHYGTVTTVDLDDDDLPALSPEAAAVVEAAKEWRTASIEWGKAARRGEVLGIAADHRDNAVNALIATVDALLAAERASTEEDR